MHLPSLDDFTQFARQYDVVPVYRNLLSDCLTPVSGFRLLDDMGAACLFESVIGGEKVGRYSFIAVGPSKRISARGNQVTIEIPGSLPQSFRSDDPLQTLREHLTVRQVAKLEQLPPFIGGAIGYAGYDVVRYVERLQNSPPDDRNLPDLDFSFFNSVVAFDNVRKTITVVTLADLRESPSAEQAWRDACDRVDELVSRLSRSSQSMKTADIGVPSAEPLDIESNFTEQAFCEAVTKCIDYIRAGDIFQVVPSQRFAVHTMVDPFEIYRSLRVVNPSPFMFYLRTADCTLVGCSPEIMCRVADRQVTVRPLAGTRPRGKDIATDLLLEAELLADPKERAEHVMLVDLGRNDVGRVAKFGTVKLTEIMVVERYSHVMHISSEVQGTLRAELDAFDALKACLPAGTVSGAPKVRAMEIIDEIEPTRRGPYGGAVGYIDYRGNIDTCIALRTIVIKDQVAYVQAGCGVVADSQPKSEYQETVNKAQAMIRAIEMTEARLASKS